MSFSQQEPDAQMVAKSGPTETPDYSSRKSRFWSRTNVIISGTLAVVGAVTGVITVVPILTRDATNFNSLELASVKVSDHISEWALSDEALKDEFPAGGGVACSSDQLAWLEERATPLQNRLMLDMRNTAAEGPMLALQDFRAVGVEEGQTVAVVDEDTARIRLICDPRSGNHELVQVARLDADRVGTVARFVRITADGQPLPEMPVAWNLAPGETGKVELQLFGRLGSRGQLAVDVTSRGETREFLVEGSEFGMPPLLYSGDMFLRATSEGLVCQKVENAHLVSCTLEEAQVELALRNGSAAN